MLTSNTLPTSNREAAYDNLQKVILLLADKQSHPRQPERSFEFRALVDQALQAYRDYMRATEASAVH